MLGSKLMLVGLAAGALSLTACSDPATQAASPGSAPASAGAAGGGQDVKGGAACGSAGEAMARRYADGVNSGNLDGTVSAFAEDAVVIDTGRRIEGRDAIRGWVDNEVMGGKLDLLECSADNGAARMLVNFAPGGSGGFKAYYIFHTEGDQITTLDLQYA
jgi:hypothetical protein